MARRKKRTKPRLFKRKRDATKRRKTGQRVKKIVRYKLVGRAKKKKARKRKR